MLTTQEDTRTANDAYVHVRDKFTSPIDEIQSAKPNELVSNSSLVHEIFDQDQEHEASVSRAFAVLYGGVKTSVKSH